jgi:hypothetical protein
MALMRLYSRGVFPINRLLKADKGFIGGFTDIWDFSCSASSHPLHKDDLNKKHPNEVVGYEWQGALNLCVKNTRIRLHTPPGDEGLFKLEKKLILLRDKLHLYTKHIESRHKKEGLVFTERCWLNPDEWGTDYTGYVSAYVAENGYARLSIADCHRSISIWIDEPFIDKNSDGDSDALVLDKVSEETMGLLRGITGVVDKAIDQIDLLRAGFSKTLQQSRELVK